MGGKYEVGQILKVVKENGNYAYNCVGDLFRIVKANRSPSSSTNYYSMFGIYIDKEFHCEEDIIDDMFEVVGKIKNGKPISNIIDDTDTIDFIKLKLSQEEFMGFLKGSIIEYGSKENKNYNIYDYKKMDLYLQELIKTLEEVE